MQRHKQTKAELIPKLGEVLTDWKDEFAQTFVSYLEDFNEGGLVTPENLKDLLEKNFEAGITLFRLVLEQSKDEFTETLKALFYNNESGHGKTAFRKNPDQYVMTLESYGLLKSLESLMSRNYTWKEVVQERLKMGRGSAIKGQRRGKNLEDFVETLVKQVFDEFDIRKSFIGANGLSSAKADFCIPSTQHPSIVIEVKAYGATGSKQSDVIGDVRKIIDEKRSDTYFFLVTDGVTWTARMSDFERLIKFQNLGDIYRIYTQQMREDLLSDLKQIKAELNI
ncbi:DpnII family type II restriction endonuclease [Fulvivirgaceae bacterium BMA12]|uniref:DpnII family type II restriction endonuclease n=1 Tax=Agaribacillus aureus TaxID=3051825 RepID=A0ABT8LE73_9BACT|nr:DpnII family type II restriction endonuclease [Fulvivirgaceae bacterium BMA12]